MLQGRGTQEEAMQDVKSWQTARLEVAIPLNGGRRAAWFMIGATAPGVCQANGRRCRRMPYGVLPDEMSQLACHAND